MKVLDLFSGIGGFAIAALRANLEIIAFCEVDKFCQKILKKHWPHIQNLEDITKIGIEQISSAGVSHARTLVTQATAPELPPAVRDFGGTWSVPFAWFDQSTGLWRTWQACFQTGWTPYLETWPRAGMTQNGIAYQRQPLVPLTRGTGSGLLPTLGANESKGSSQKRYKGSPYFRGAKMSEGLRTCQSDPIYTNPNFAEAAMGFPKDWTLLEMQ